MDSNCVVEKPMFIQLSKIISDRRNALKETNLSNTAKTCETTGGKILVKKHTSIPPKTNPAPRRREIDLRSIINKVTPHREEELPISLSDTSDTTNATDTTSTTNTTDTANAVNPSLSRKLIDITLNELINLPTRPRIRKIYDLLGTVKTLLRLADAMDTPEGKAPLESTAQDMIMGVFAGINWNDNEYLQVAQDMVELVKRVHARHRDSNPAGNIKLILVRMCERPEELHYYALVICGYSEQVEIHPLDPRECAGLTIRPLLDLRANTEILAGLYRLISSLSLRVFSREAAVRLNQVSGRDQPSTTSLEIRPGEASFCRPSTRDQPITILDSTPSK